MSADGIAITVRLWDEAERVELTAPRKRFATTGDAETAAGILMDFVDPEHYAVLRIEGAGVVHAEWRSMHRGGAAYPVWHQVEPGALSR